MRKWRVASGEWHVASGRAQAVWPVRCWMNRGRKSDDRALGPWSLGIGHSGFTLIELLVTIAIITILAALLLGVAATAGERGREARTKSMIARLHTLISEQYESYASRRAPISDNVRAQINSNISNVRARGPALADARLYALRELMVMEMPDRWSDVLLNAVPETGNPAAVTPAAPLYLKSTSGSTYGGPTPLIEAYRRHYFTVANGINSITGAPNTAEQVLANQGAECLYMIVMFATADGEARGLFNEKDIGDTDGDGAPEFLDGWGNPISFIRWAPGLESDLQANANQLGDRTSQPWLAQAAADHDPMDPFRREPYAFRLVPFIYSAGGDERYDIYTARGTTTWPDPNPSPTTFGTPRLNPYKKVTSIEGEWYLGTAVADTATDNIHNHNITSQ